MALNEPTKTIHEHEVAVEKTMATEMKIKVTSREMVKPSSPTPIDKKTVYFSLLDQLAFNSYIPLLFFYNPKNTTATSDDQTLLLKTSLSETLVTFFPLAGRIQNNELIDCNDQGAEFSESLVSQDLHTFLENPSLDDLQSLLPFRQLLPHQGTFKLRHENIVLSVQINNFSCGGLAIGLCLSHKIGDLSAPVHFLKSWASLACKPAQDTNNNKIPKPDFSGASQFPPLKELNESTPPSLEIGEEKIGYTTLIFNKKAIDELKAGSNVTRPTKVEVVTAFIGKHWPNHFSSILQVVNLRKKMVIDPPIPINFLGNCVWSTRTIPISDPEQPEVIINEFRNAIAKLSGDYMKAFLFSENFLMRLKEENEALFEKPEELIIANSLCGFQLYELDFGLGKPIWVYPGYQHPKNYVLTMPTQCGNGIEAWVSMLENDLLKFDTTLSQLDYPIIKAIL